MMTTTEKLITAHKLLHEATQQLGYYIEVIKSWEEQPYNKEFSKEDQDNCVESLKQKISEILIQIEVYMDIIDLYNKEE